MSYASYLNEQVRECLSLAVAEPWSRDAAELIDLAETYSSLASRAALEERHKILLPR
jgi:hypothetical protein